MEETYRLYKRNFPDNIREEKTERSILADPGNFTIERRDENGELFASCVVNRSTILLLCVDKEHRGRGIGSQLLAAAERHILDSGYATVNIGEGFDYLTPGVPIRDGAVSFFEHRGYVHAWGESECFDMAADLEMLCYPLKPGSSVEGVRYDFASLSDLPAVRECVRNAEPKFVQFYDKPALFQEANSQRVLAAQKDGVLCGALIVSRETEAKGVGSVGCTAVHADFRHRGIATNLVRIGTGYLKDSGLSKGYLGYTYSGLDRLYARAGYRITTRYMMAEKQLRG